jgi:hypothetical protein
MGQRRCIILSTVMFRVNLFNTRKVRAIDTICLVPMCCLVVCRMKLSSMVKLCSKDKILLDIGMCKRRSNIIGSVLKLDL